MYISLKKLTEIFDNGYFSLSLIFIGIGSCLVSLFLFAPLASKSIFIEDFLIICFIVGAGALSTGVMFGCVGFYIDERPKVKLRVKVLYFSASAVAVGCFSEHLINFYV